MLVRSAKATFRAVPIRNESVTLDNLCAIRNVRRGTALHPLFLESLVYSDERQSRRAADHNSVFCRKLGGKNRSCDNGDHLYLFCSFFQFARRTPQVARGKKEGRCSKCKTLTRNRHFYQWQWGSGGYRL